MLFPLTIRMFKLLVPVYLQCVCFILCFRFLVSSYNRVHLILYLQAVLCITLNHAIEILIYLLLNKFLVGYIVIWLGFF